MVIDKQSLRFLDFEEALIACARPVIPYSSIDLEVRVPPRKGSVNISWQRDQILNVQGLSASIEGETLFTNVDLNMAKGDKIVLFSKDSRATTAFYEIY